MLKSSIVSPFILALMFVTGTILAAPLLQPTPIAYGESIQDDLTASQARDYMFQGTSGDIITIDLAAEFDGVLELVAPDDTILAFDDDSGVGLNPLIEAVTLPETGEYIIRVSSFASLGEGSFTLSLTRTGTGEPTTPDDAPTANVIPIGFAEATSGILEPGQSLRFTLDAQMGDVLTASVQSDFDAVLEVSGPTGEFIVFDDDSGGNRQPIIENITLPTTGLYTLVLSGFDEQAGGSYTLEIGPNPATTTTPT
ncbi:MAG: pre-peptidase C-terminal domain-containing protein, partial [Anaerolineales bacterium]